MQKNIITNKITPCCGLPFSVVYWWVSNLTLNSESDRQFILSKISQNGTLSIDGWKVLINSGTLESDASLTKPEFLAWFSCEKQPSCEQLKLIIEGYKMGSWAGDLSEISFVNVLGVLEITDTAPTTQGLYILSDVGTYTNLGGIVTTAGKLNYAYFDGTTWSLVSVDVSNSIGVNGGQNISFSPSIYFNNNLSISTKTVNAPITFIPSVNESTILGGSTLVRLIADGNNVPDFSKFKKLSGSQNYVNTAGTLNACYFFYDGIDAWVNIWQGVGSSQIVTNDTTPPTTPTNLTASETTSSSTKLSWTASTDNTGIAGYEIYKDGTLIDTVSASHYTVTGLSASTTYAFTVKAKNAAGNTSTSSNSVSITTSAIIIENVVFDSLSGATYNSGTNTLSSSSENTGGLRTTAISGDFEVFSENTISSASVIALKSSTSGSYTWAGGSGLSFLISSFFYNNQLSVSINGSTTVFQAQVSTTDTKIKMKRVGNDCLIYTSADGVNWTLRHTQTGVFSGITNIFVQGIFAITQANTMSLKLKQL